MQIPIGGTEGQDLEAVLFSYGNEKYLFFPNKELKIM